MGTDEFKLFLTGVRALVERLGPELNDPDVSTWRKAEVRATLRRIYDDLLAVCQQSHPD